MQPSLVIGALGQDFCAIESAERKIHVRSVADTAVNAIPTKGRGITD